jgi:glycosyltransferase involved in cell wall biosynthesis
LRILLLCDRVPDAPSDGLLLRVLALARVLSARHTIDVLCLGHRDRMGAIPEGLYHRVWIAAPPVPRPSAGWYAPFTGWRPRDLYIPSPEAAVLLTSEIDPGDYDVIWDAGAVLLAQLPARWNGVPVVADLVDDMVLTFRRAMVAEPRLLQRLRLWKYAYIFGRFERECMRRAACCVVVSDEDAASFAKVSPRVPVSVVANGVDTTYFAPDGASEVPGRLVFEGTMSFPPNELAALFLVREIMPRVWAMRPDATVTLVGRDPTPAVRALASDRVLVTGSVHDVRLFVREAEVFVCPLVSGAGIKNKILQAWAMARPVVATSVSVGGLSARDGSDLLVRDGADAFAEAVVELLADPLRRDELGRSGREVARNRFAWAAMAKRFEALLSEAVVQHATSAH